MENNGQDGINLEPKIRKNNFDSKDLRLKKVKSSPRVKIKKELRNFIKGSISNDDLEDRLETNG
jgi:hypothetical protein